MKQRRGRSTAPADPGELLDNAEQEQLIQKYQKQASAQDRGSRLKFGGVCYLLGALWLVLVYLLVDPDNGLAEMGFSLAPLRRLPSYDATLFHIGVQCLSLSLQCGLLFYAGYKLRALHSPNSTGMMGVLAALSVYWTVLFFARGILVSQFAGYFMLCLAPSLIFSTIFFMDWELSAMVRDVNKLEEYRYNYEKP